MSATSLDVRACVLAWFRFAKQFEYVATEFELGLRRADAVGASARELLEVEVKMSAADLERDFVAKAAKHARYNLVSAGDYGVPNRLYFAVPERLRARALQILAKKAPAYGLIVLLGEDQQAYYRQVPWKALTVARSAKWLHRDAPTPRLLGALRARMAAEVAGFHLMAQHFGALFAHTRALMAQYEASRPLAAADAEELLAAEAAR